MFVANRRRIEGQEVAVGGRNPVRQRRCDSVAVEVQVLPLIHDSWAEGDHKRAKTSGQS
jgi:ppGpp synthetase/RelA/SpoT-type nucleotidyltranferase